MGYIDADTAVLVIVVWTIARDFFIAPALVRRHLIRHANALVEQLFVGLANLLQNPAKKAALEAILKELVPTLRTAAKEAMGKAPTIKEMIGLGIAQRLGLVPAMGPGQGAPQGAPQSPASGPQTARGGPFWRR